MEYPAYVVLIASTKVHYKKLGMTNLIPVSFFTPNFVPKKHTRKNILLNVLDLIELITEKLSL